MSARDARIGRLTAAALRCYPARWRRRHGDEAAELAALLIADGIPAASIVWSYLVGAAREWLAPRPGTDSAMVLAIAHVWITEELYDKDYVARRTHGFECDHTLQQGIRRNKAWYKANHHL